MRWDIFCKVIDNHGDLGVCWRLASQAAAAGEHVRLWVDDGSALAWMAPGGQAGIEVVDWSDPAAVGRALQAEAPQVLIEAFGCDPEPALVARFAASVGARPWINLEYLSAEPYVERLHGLPSPVFHGPGAGLVKRFFYPGFTAATGGLLREAGLVQRQAALDRAAWLAGRGIVRRGERVVSLFCYEPAALQHLLADWADGEEPTLLLVTAGRATQAVREALPTDMGDMGDMGGMGDIADIGALRIQYLPPMPQTAFDELLWCCDLNFVRGEDSLVRALWAGAPFVWQIYPQDDDAHHEKLDAFLDQLQAPASLRAFHAAWNGISGERATSPDAATLADWREATQAARRRLLAQPDLLTQLRAGLSPASAPDS